MVILGKGKGNVELKNRKEEEGIRRGRRRDKGK